MKARLLQKCVITAAGWTIVLAGCCFYLFNAVTKRLVAQSDASVTPFVLQREIYSFGNNPNGELRTKQTIARRSDGATSGINSMGPLAKGVYVRTIQFLDGSRVELADSLKSKTTWPPSEAQAAIERAKILHPPQNCVFTGDTLVSEGTTLLGQKVAVVEQTYLNGPRFTEWRAPALGCQELQARSEDPRPDGSYKLVTETGAVSLRLVEPDPALFDTGQGYAELKPSVMESAILTSFGETPELDANGQRLRDSMDRSYDQRWAQR